jgi:ankyrin repeat protein
MSAEELFSAVGRGDARAVAGIVAAQPELARALNAERLPVLVFARFIGRNDIYEALLRGGPPLDIFEAAMVDAADRVDELLHSDASLTGAYDDAGFTALHYAAYYGAPAAVRVLLAGGARTDAVTKNFLANMPLHAAAAGGHRDICSALLDAGAEVNARQHGGFTPLHTAAFRDDRAMVDLFLRHGADAAITSDDGKTAADFGAGQGHAQIAAYLRTRPGR